MNTLKETHSYPPGEKHWDHNTLVLVSRSILTNTQKSLFLDHILTVMHAYNPRIQQAKAGGSLTWGQNKQANKHPSPPKKHKKNPKRNQKVQNQEWGRKAPVSHSGLWDSYRDLLSACLFPKEHGAHRLHILPFKLVLYRMWYML